MKSLELLSLELSLLLTGLPPNLTELTVEHFYLTVNCRVDVARVQVATLGDGFFLWGDNLDDYERRKLEMGL